MANEDGVWRTVGGRRIFIKDGQSLSDAMKSSGKFKSVKKKEQSETTEAKKTNYSEMDERELKDELYDADRMLNEMDRRLSGRYELSNEQREKLEDRAANYEAKRDEIKAELQARKEEKSKVETQSKYTDKQLEMVWENEDATEVYDHLSQSEKNKMSQAQKDMEILTRGTPGYQNAKEYVDKMNDKAASKFLETHKNDKDYEGYYMSDKYVAGENKKLDINDQKYNIEKSSGLKVEKAFQADAFGTGKEDRFKLEDGRYVAHNLEDDSWSINKVESGKINGKDFKSYDDMLKNLNDKDTKKSGSDNAYKKAFEEYKKKHPNSKITLNKFIDMSEGK